MQLEAGCKMNKYMTPNYKMFMSAQWSLSWVTFSQTARSLYVLPIQECVFFECFHFLL